MKIILAIAFYFLYWGVCFLGTGTDRKNLIGLRSYPEAVQNRVRSDPQLGTAVPKAKSAAAVLLSNLLLFHSRVFRSGTCAERRAEPGRLSAGILVLPCVRRGIGAVRSSCDRSALVAQHKTHPFLVFAGEEILSGSEKAYRILFARDPIVRRNCRTDGPGRYRALKHRVEKALAVRAPLLTAPAG